MSEDLRALIESAAAELNPGDTQDNQEVAEDVEEDVDYEVDESEEDVTEEDTPEEEVEESDDEDAEDSDADGEKFSVKVDGEVFEVTLDELKSGYQRQADYTREKQALKASIEEFETVREEFTEQVNAMSELDGAWEENPVGVLAHFASNTANPTQAVALLIQDLAAQNLLDRSFMEMFGITPEIQKEWARESELTALRSQTQEASSSKNAELESAKMELEVQRAIAQYDAQIDEIIDSENLNLTVKERNAFRKELATYAAENELTNLKAAYKALKYEESQKNKALAAKTVAKAKQKKATSVVSRSGAGEGTPVSDTSDLNAVIRAAMKESSN